jgi:hypothetical protein
MSSLTRMATSATVLRGASTSSLVFTSRSSLTLRGNRWEQEIIEQDNRKYNRSAAETIARTPEEIDAAVLPGANDVPAGEDEEENAASTHEDRREVHISGLGDLAALATAAVVRSSA